VENHRKKDLVEKAKKEEEKKNKMRRVND